MVVTSNDFLIKPLPEILFGKGKITLLPACIEKYGKNCLIITGKSFLTTQQWLSLTETLQNNNCEIFLAEVVQEPSPEIIDIIVHKYSGTQIDCVIAIGGGSVLDAGKAVSAMLCEPASIKEYLEGVGSLKPSGKKVPFIAVPTTSGTGSEATSNSVITQTGTSGFKKSLRHDNYIPNIAIVDPELTLSCPPALTAACGMDCFSQLIEGYLSINSSVFTDSIALEAIKLVATSIKTCFYDQTDISARSSMAYGALISGVVLTNSGLGTVHGLAPILGSTYKIPHGVVCGTLMASANSITLKKVRETECNPAALAKYATLGRIVHPEAAHKSEGCLQDAFINFLEELTSELSIPTLDKFGVNESSFDFILENGSNKNNPVALDNSELKKLLKARII